MAPHRVTAAVKLPKRPTRRSGPVDTKLGWMLEGEFFSGAPIAHRQALGAVPAGKR